MSRITTPISNNRREVGDNTNSPASRVFTVTPPTEEELSSQSVNPVYNRNRNIPEGAREISQAELKALRQQAIQKSEQAENVNLSHERDLIEQITGIGRRVKTVEVNEENYKHTFTLRTLKGWEKKDVIRVYESIPKKTIGVGNDMRFVHDASGEQKLKIISLSHALCAIDNIDIDSILSISNLQDEEKVNYKSLFIEELDDYLTDYLYVEYNYLSKTASDGYALKYPNSAAEQKGVAEAIKKSS